jgi:hypothetical protein
MSRSNGLDKDILALVPAQRLRPKRAISDRQNAEADEGKLAGHIFRLPSRKECANMWETQ